MDGRSIEEQVVEARRRVQDGEWQILKCKGDILGMASRPSVYLVMRKLEQLEKAQEEKRAQLDALTRQLPSKHPEIGEPA